MTGLIVLLLVALLVAGILIGIVVNQFRFENELEELRADLRTLRQRLEVPQAAVCPQCGLPLQCEACEQASAYEEP